MGFNSSKINIQNGGGQIIGPTIIPNLTGSLFGTASYALNSLGGGGGSGITISDSAPTGSAANTGSLWFNSNNLGLYVRYQDTDGGQWVAASAVGPVSTSSFALSSNQSISSSYALTASFVAGNVLSASYASNVGRTIVEPVTITATTTNPTKGTTTVDRIMLTDNGNGTCTILMNYYQSTAGTAGSGNYLFTLPGGYQFDTSFHNQYAVVGDPGLSGVEAWIPGGTGKVTAIFSNLMAAAYGMVWDATRFRILMGSEMLYGSNTGYRSPVGSGFFAMNAGGIGFQIGFTFKKA